MNDKLETLRNRIDELDNQLVEILNKRAEAAVEIGKIKAVNGDALYVPARERSVLHRLIAQNKGPLSHASIWQIFSEVMASSLALEHHEHVLAGGADADSLRYAVDFIAGGNAELTSFRSTDSMVEALQTSGDAVAVVHGSWLNQIRGSAANVQWSGCWLIENKQTKTAERFHLLKPVQANGVVMGPVRIYCLVDEAGKNDVLSSGLIDSIPARSINVYELGNDTQSIVLKFRLETDDAQHISRLVSEIAQKCNFVWTV